MEVTMSMTAETYVRAGIDTKECAADARRLPCGLTELFLSNRT